MLFYRFYLVLAALMVLFLLFVSAKPRAQATLSKFSTHYVIQPQIHHGRTKKDLKSTLDVSDGLHADHIILSYIHQGQRIQIELLRNDLLLPDRHFLRYQNAKYEITGHEVRNFTKTEVDLCHYKGHIRGRADSKVALSTCNGEINGIVFDGQHKYFIHPHIDGNGQLQDDHYLFSLADIKQQNGTRAHSWNRKDWSSPNWEVHRRRRDTEDDDPISRGPYNADKYSSYVELVFVVDNKVYKDLGENITEVHQHCKDLANIVHALYEPLNIFIVLVGVVVWNESNEIEVISNPDKTLKNFLNYRSRTLLMEHPNDNAHLLTGQTFDDRIVGKAGKGTMCTFNRSGGISVNNSPILSEVATTIAHEMGHNFDMDHDNEDCKCPDDKCIMSGTSTSVMPVRWSSCSIDQLTFAFSRGMNYCLRNKPVRMFDSPQCGNGFVEPGEQCDCGLPNHCKNPCCNAYTCMLHSNASCATGECCSLKTCRPKLAGSSCREAESECDLPEYCTGESEYCPKDVYRRDAEPCDNGEAFCFNGTCQSHSNQCRVLWGSTGVNSVHCYDKNKEGDRLGNCGYNRVNKTFVPCDAEDVHCGMLHCIHLNERLEFGMESTAILSHSYVIHKRKITDCHSALLDLGAQNIDPGLTPNGAKCGDNKMCIDQQCVAVEQILAKGKDCPENCNSRGVCNSRGHCHCHFGYGGDSCSRPGFGGSVDSGPAINSRIEDRGRQYLYLLLLLIIPIVAISWLIIKNKFLTKANLYMYVSNWKSSMQKTIACCISTVIACLSKKRYLAPTANFTSTANTEDFALSSK